MPAAIQALYRQGHGGNAALSSLRQQAGQDIHQAHGIAEAAGGAPVRGKNLFLNRWRSQRAVRETIEGEDVELLGGKKVLKPGQGVAGQEFPGLPGGKTQTQTEGPIRGEAGAEPRHQGTEIAEQLRPAPARVDLGAVSQVE